MDEEPTKKYYSGTVVWGDGLGPYGMIRVSWKKNFIYDNSIRDVVHTLIEHIGMGRFTEEEITKRKFSRRGGIEGKVVPHSTED